MAGKIRCIDLLTSRFSTESSDDLYAEIMCGEIKINGHTVRNPLQQVPSDAVVVRRCKRFVSRGGIKLDHVLTHWNIDVSGRIFLDAGSSTGGFTDCLLQRGASWVHAVDVGYNQLDWRLRSDKRVVVHERVNIMDLTFLDPLPDAAVADLSFRSLRRAAAHILSLTRHKWCIALIKPQFEIEGLDEESFDGVIRDNDVRVRVVSDLLKDLSEEGVYAAKILNSPITGRKGNSEILALLQEEPVVPELDPAAII